MTSKHYAFHCLCTNVLQLVGPTWMRFPIFGGGAHLNAFLSLEVRWMGSWKGLCINKHRAKNKSHHIILTLDLTALNALWTYGPLVGTYGPNSCRANFRFTSPINRSILSLQLHPCKKERQFYRNVPHAIKLPNPFQTPLVVRIRPWN